MDRKTLTIAESADRAFELRQLYFGNEITFHAPGLKHYHIEGFEQKNPAAFLPISVTGSGCALDCDHCESKILEPMIALNPKEGLFTLCERLAKSGTEAVLVSGGSQRSGKVPLAKHMEDLRRIKQELGLKVMVHTGLVDEDMAKGLASAGVDGVALDIIGANETIKQVYHLDCTVDAYDHSLNLLTDYGLSIRPHIILGLHYGKFLGEYQALDMIGRYPVHALILVIFMPLHGTRMQKTAPPPTDEVAAFFRHARLQMPETKILVGCARPAGEYKQIVDRAAVDAGLNGIAYPAEGVIEHALAKGLVPTYFENSCSCGVD